MITLGYGSLIFDYKHKRLFDGANWLIPLSLSLILKLFKHKDRKDKIAGEWLAIKNVIIWFNKK